MSNALAERPSAAPVPEAATARPARSPFFNDIAGLRGIAVTVVVLFHAHVPNMTGGFVGVDLFFVISGFLISGLLIREYERTGTISFRGFYARRARRIIPPAAVVILVTALAMCLVLPLLKVFKQSLDLLAAAANVANWHFIAQNADYLAGGIDESVATHFWSLSVEEQFYFVWPLTIFFAAALASRTRLGRVMSMRTCVGIVVGLITVVSLIASLRLTETAAGTAYMATYTRAWQFGAGALVAVAIPWLLRISTTRWARVSAFILGWCGAAAIAYSVVEFSSATPYPGTAALVPTLGATAIIACGQVVGTKGLVVGRVLDTSVLRFLGRVSYAWYLWHWPMLTLYIAQTGDKSWPHLVIVAGVALLTATASTFFFEERVNNNAGLRKNLSASISVGVTGLVVGLAITMTVGVLSVKEASKATMANASVSYESVFGKANSTLSGAVTPNPFQAFDDRPRPDKCLVELGVDSSPADCVYGPAGGVPVALFGDSHANAWQPAVSAIAMQHNWRVHQFTKAACPAQNLQPQTGRNERFVSADCLAWRQKAIQQIKELNPKIIVISSLSTYVPTYQESKDAWDDTLGKLRSVKAKMVYIADTPYPGFHVADCMSGATDDWKKCEFPIDKFNRIQPIVTEQLKGSDSDIVTVGVDNLLCEKGTCFPARNHILLYRDESHLTATAAKALAPALTMQLDKLNFDYTGR